MVEYGQNEILGSVRTEFINPHLIRSSFLFSKQTFVSFFQFNITQKWIYLIEHFVPMLSVFIIH